MAQYQLVMKSGPTPGKVFDLNLPDLTIGREAGNAIVINDAEISRRHARLHLEGGGYILEDLGSTNGCFVNGQRLMGPHVLRPGELIMCGENVGLVYEIVNADADATIAAGPGQFVAPFPQQPVYTPPTPSALPAYSEPIEQAPIPEYSEPIPVEPAQKSSSRTWILAGCGCLLILLCICGISAYAFDAMDLYCQAPFDTIFQAAGYCP